MDASFDDNGSDGLNNTVEEVVESEISVENAESPEKHETQEKKRLLRLPLARVKNMIKTDPEVGNVSQDAVFLITKATELLVELLAKESVKHMSSTKRKTIFERDVYAAIDQVPNLCFLDGALESK